MRATRKTPTPAEDPAARRGVSRSTEGAARSLSIRKRWFFSIFTAAIPFLFLGALEIGLRALDYGPNLSLFTTGVVNGTTYCLLNHGVKARYFPDIPFSATTAREYFSVPKAEGTFRIFVLGGSTAVGYPYGPNGSFPSFLRQRLARLFPDRRFDVINLGMTGTNSFTVLDLARELPSYQPDLLIVYDGHNEFYGGLGVQSRGIPGGSRTTTLLYLRLLHSRVFLLLRDAFGGLRALFYPSQQSGAPRDVSLETLSRGKEVPLGSPAYFETLRSFEENLAEFRSFCMARHLPVILGTQVSNLRGQPPFVSGEDPSIPDAARREFDGDRRTAEKAWNEQRWTDALSAYRNAALLDSLHAATHFAIGRCLDILGERRVARLQYVQARDDDELRFRASSDFNAAILRQAEGGAAGVVDMERLFMAYSPDSIIGNELILEHLHPNSSGYFLMAKGYAAAIRRLGLLAGEDEWSRRDTLDERALWNDRAVTELDERIAIERTARLTSTFPFTTPSLSVPATLPHDSLETFALRVIDGKWGTGDGHLAAAENYLSHEDWSDAAREYNVLITLDPLATGSFIGLARTYVREKRFPEASRVLLSSLNVEPTCQAYAMLGEIAYESGDDPGAENAYEKALPYAGSPEERTRVSYELALAELRMRRIEEARQALQQALAASPEHQPSLELLHALQNEKRNR